MVGWLKRLFVGRKLTTPPEDRPLPAGIRPAPAVMSAETAVPMGGRPSTSISPGELNRRRVAETFNRPMPPMPTPLEPYLPPAIPPGLQPVHLDGAAEITVEMPERRSTSISPGEANRRRVAEILNHPARTTLTLPVIPEPRHQPTIPADTPPVTALVSTETTAQMVERTATSISQGKLHQQRVAEILNRPVLPAPPLTTPPEPCLLSTPPPDMPPVPAYASVETTLVGAKKSVVEGRALLANSWPANMPQYVAFVDVETTGLTGNDRIVSFACILLKTSNLVDGEFDLSYVHIICDPGRKCHPKAQAVHGYTDWELQHQDTFADKTELVIEIISRADLVVAHNAAFDISFINRELRAAGHLMLEKTTYCTMQACRKKGVDRSSLSAVAAQIGLARSNERHTALEDAWLAMMIYLWLHDCPARFSFSAFGDARPKNLRPTPPTTAGPLIRRKEVAPIAADSESRIVSRLFDDDDLQAAWELFEKKNYEPALAYAMAAVIKDDVRENGEPDSLPYEIACMLLRRQGKLIEEHDLLWQYFRRTLGDKVTADQIIALATPSFESGPVLTEYVEDGSVVHSDAFRRPRPAVWQMAARFVRLKERLEKKTETNDDRLARALTALPAEAAFVEAAVCIRRLIADKAKARQDTRNELLRLHGLGQQHSFLYGSYRLGWDHVENKMDADAGLYPHVAAVLATRAELDAILLPYRDAGYLNLPLLNKTDIKRLVTAFGDPAEHVSPRERNREIWNRYREKARQIFDQQINGNQSSLSNALP